MPGVFEKLTISLLIWCAVFGIAGQLLRSVLGIYKLYEKNPKKIRNSNWFDPWRFFFSLLLGGLIGSVMSLVYVLPLSNADILGIMSVSYMGVDGLEGVIRSRAGKLTNNTQE